MKVTEVILMLMVTDLLTISSDKKVVNYLDRDFHTSHYLDTFYFVFLNPNPVTLKKLVILLPGAFFV